jgi:hypothetical protein
MNNAAFTEFIFPELIPTTGLTDRTLSGGLLWSKEIGRGCG